METSSRDEQGCASLLTKAFLISLPAQLRGSAARERLSGLVTIAPWSFSVRTDRIDIIQRPHAGKQAGPNRIYGADPPGVPG